MLTPEDVRNKSFKGGIGFDKRDVENYMLTLSEDYETLYRSNVELKDKVTTLNQSLSHYRSMEDSIQKSMTLSEKTAEETVSAAKDQARQITGEASRKAESIVADAKEELQNLKEEIARLTDQFALFKKQYRHILDMQIQSLNGEIIDIDLGDFERPKKNQTEAAGSEEGGLGGLGGGYVGSNSSGGNYDRPNQEPAFNRGSLNMDPFAEAEKGGRFSVHSTGGGIQKKAGQKKTGSTGIHMAGESQKPGVGMASAGSRPIHNPQPTGNSYSQQTVRGAQTSPVGQTQQTSGGVHGVSAGQTQQTTSGVHGASAAQTQQNPSHFQSTPGGQTQQTSVNFNTASATQTQQASNSFQTASAGQNQQTANGVYSGSRAASGEHAAPAGQTSQSTGGMYSNSAPQSQQTFSGAGTATFKQAQQTNGGLHMASTGQPQQALNGLHMASSGQPQQALNGLHTASSGQQPQQASGGLHTASSGQPQQALNGLHMASSGQPQQTFGNPSASSSLNSRPESMGQTIKAQSVANSGNDGTGHFGQEDIAPEGFGFHETTLSGDFGQPSDQNAEWQQPNIHSAKFVTSPSFKPTSGNTNNTGDNTQASNNYAADFRFDSDSFEDEAYQGEVENRVRESGMLDSEDNYASGFDFVSEDSEASFGAAASFENTSSFGEGSYSSNYNSFEYNEGRNEQGSFGYAGGAADYSSAQVSSADSFNEDETYTGEVENRVNESTMLDSEDNYAEGLDFIVGDDNPDDDIPTI